MLNKKEIIEISGITATITGCIIGTGLMIKSGIERKKEIKEINKRLDDIEQQTKYIDKLLDKSRNTDVDIKLIKTILQSLTKDE